MGRHEQREQVFRLLFQVEFHANEEMPRQMRLFLEDNEENVLEITKAAHQAGARFIYAAFGMTLRDSQREWYFKNLEALFPGQGLAAKYAAIKQLDIQPVPVILLIAG